MIVGRRGESGREGARPPLKFSPPLKQIQECVMKEYLFERGTKGVSLKTTNTKPNLSHGDLTGNTPFWYDFLGHMI